MLKGIQNPGTIRVESGSGGQHWQGKEEEGTSQNHFKLVVDSLRGDKVGSQTSQNPYSNTRGERGSNLRGGTEKRAERATFERLNKNKRKK